MDWESDRGLDFLAPGNAWSPPGTWHGVVRGMVRLKPETASVRHALRCPLLTLEHRWRRRRLLSICGTFARFLGELRERVEVGR